MRAALDGLRGGREPRPRRRRSEEQMTEARDPDGGVLPPYSPSPYPGEEPAPSPGFASQQAPEAWVPPGPSRQPAPTVAPAPTAPPAAPASPAAPAPPAPPASHGVQGTQPGVEQGWPAQGSLASPSLGGLLLTTTDRVDGKKISRYLGVVAGEVVLGTSISKDIKGSVRGFVGGRSSSYEKEVRYARQQATLEMAHVARQMGASAVVGVSFSYVTVNALLMVSATGTAVVLEDI